MQSHKIPQNISGNSDKTLVIMNTSEIMRNLREAHRLIYAFQRCTLDFVFRVKNEVLEKGDSADGLKHFSRDLPKRKGGKSHNEVAFSAIGRHNWAWDFLPTYAYEYYLGQTTLCSGIAARASIIQIVDDAVYASARGIVQRNGQLADDTVSEMLDLSQQPPCEETRSWFVFICQTARGEFHTGLDTSDETISRFIRSGEKIEVIATPNGFDAKYLIDMKDVFTHRNTDNIITTLKTLLEGMGTGRLPQSLSKGESQDCFVDISDTCFPDH